MLLFICKKFMSFKDVMLTMSCFKKPCVESSMKVSYYIHYQKSITNFKVSDDKNSYDMNWVLHVPFYKMHSENS
jgi:hypothetical protein